MAPRTERTEWEDATIEEKVAEYEYYRARDEVANRAKDTLKRLEYAARDIREALASLEACGADAYAHGATPEQALKEEVKRASYVGQVTIDAVLVQVGNMGLGYLPREVAALEPKKIELLRAHERVARLQEEGQGS